MKTKTHFTFRVDIWDDTGDSIVEHVAGVDDLPGSNTRWPDATINYASALVSFMTAAARAR
jgi:hypothetical protein